MARTTTATGDMGRHLRQLFDAGSVVVLSDGELLERFAATRSDARRRESAFEAIAARHGPTVLSVCRRVLATITRPGMRSRRLAGSRTSP